MLNTDFVSDINDYYDAIEESTVDLPPFETRKEPEYNDYVASSNGTDFCLMDRRNIVIGGGRSSIEFCDLFTKDKKHDPCKEIWRVQCA